MGTRGLSKGEEELWLHLRASGLPLPLREYRFAPPRRWRCDFVWVQEKLIVEVEGGVYTNGRHITPKGFTNDCEKYNEAQLIGFCLLRVTTEHVKSGRALEWIEKYFKKL